MGRGGRGMGGRGTLLHVMCQPSVHPEERRARPPPVEAPDFSVRRAAPFRHVVCVTNASTGRRRRKPSPKQTLEPCSPPSASPTHPPALPPPPPYQVNSRHNPLPPPP